MMAIVLLKGGEKYYASGTGRVTSIDRLKADQLDAELDRRLAAYEAEAIQSGFILPNGVKKDALRIWYDIGRLLEDVANKYNVLGTTDEHFYWQAVYDHVSPLIQRSAPPQSASGGKNHFKMCAYMANTGSWKFVRSVGNWSVWKDLLDNSRLQQDKRVFKWVVSTIHSSGLGHKEVRPFIHEVRRSITNKDTSVLTDQELEAKLRPLVALIPKDK